MASKRILAVNELCGYIKGVFDDELILHNITVYGEVEEFKFAGGYSFFTLQGGESRLPCVVFSPIPPLEKGVSAEVDGAVRFYQKTGRISFVGHQVRLRGEGRRHAELLRLKERLQKEGVFADKKPIPKRIVRVAVVTGETGVVIHDFKRVLADAGARADIFIFGIRVQGADAEREIIKGIERVAAWGKADVCVIMRGGGSEGDLDPFNTESVVRAVKNCPVCTISAIGHETDVPLCDFAADIRAGTPSIAAGFIANQIVQTERAVRSAAESILYAIEYVRQKKSGKLKTAAEKLTSFARGKIDRGMYSTKILSDRLSVNAFRRFFQKTEVFQKAGNSLIRAVTVLQEASENKLNLSAVKLDALSPLKMLAKGFVRVERERRPIISAKELAKNDRLSLFFAEGKAEVRVEKTESK